MKKAVRLCVTGGAGGVPVIRIEAFEIEGLHKAVGPTLTPAKPRVGKIQIGQVNARGQVAAAGDDAFPNTNIPRA